MFPDALKLLRKARKINQMELAEKLGVSRSAIATWECGKRQPDFETLCRVADFFNVSADYLLGRTPMDVVVKHETPPPQGDDVLQLQFHLDDAPKDEESMEAAIRRIVIEEFEKRGL